MIDPNAASSTNPTKSKCIRQPSDVSYLKMFGVRNPA